MSRALLHALVFVIGGCSCGNGGQACSGDFFQDECSSDDECLSSEICDRGYCSSLDIECSDETSTCACDETCEDGACVPGDEAGCKSPDCVQSFALCENDEGCCDGLCVDNVCRSETVCSAGGSTCSTGSSCCSGMCDAGVCAAPKCTPGVGPEPLVGAGKALSLAQSDEALFWISDGEVRSTAKRGGPIEVLATGDWHDSIARFDTRLAWASNTGEVWSRSDLNGAASLTSQSPTPVWMVTASSQGVFWTGYGADVIHAVYAAPNASPSPATLLTTIEDTDAFHAIASDEAHVYFSDGHVIGRVPITDGVAAGPVETLRLGADDGGVGIAHLALDEENVYFVDDGAVRTVPKSGGAERVLAVAVDAGYGITADDDDVYWIESGGAAPQGPQALVLRMPKDGGEREVLAASTPNFPRDARSVLVDDACVYWIDTTHRLLMRTAK